MAGRIIPLTAARRLAIEYNRAIVEPARRDLTDYGAPGVHGLGPRALPGRSKAAYLGIPGATEREGAPTPSPFDECIGPGGWTVVHHPSVATGQTGDSSQIDVAGPFAGPAVCTGVGYISNTAFSGSQSFGVLASEDNTTIGGVSTTGLPLLNDRATGIRIFPRTTWQDIYPYIRIPFTQFWTKVVIENNTGGTVILDVAIALRRL